MLSERFAISAERLQPAPVPEPVPLLLIYCCLNIEDNRAMKIRKISYKKKQWRPPRKKKKKKKEGKT
jgi:hypothetical protein